MVERKMKLRYLPFQHYKNPNQISSDQYEANNNPLNLSAIRSTTKFDQKLFQSKINNNNISQNNHSQNKFISQIGNS